MRTTLDIDPKLLEEITAITGQKNKSKAVCEALKEYVRQKKTARLISLLGNIDIEEDWRKLRDGELGEER